MISRNQFAYELGYFWGLGGTLQGLITPDIAYGFPDPQFIFFFINHAGIITALLYLTFTRLRPVPASLPRVVAATLGLCRWWRASRISAGHQLRLSRRQARHRQRDGFSFALALVHPRAGADRHSSLLIYYVPFLVLDVLEAVTTVAARDGAVLRSQAPAQPRPFQAKAQPSSSRAARHVAGMDARHQPLQLQRPEGVGDRRAAIASRA